MKLEWKDVSSYSQNDKNRVPRTFLAKAGHLSITVTRHIHYAPTDWILVCEPWFTQEVIGNGTAEEARHSALVAVLAKLKSALDTLTTEEE